MVSVQHALIDVISFLDPDGLRFAREGLARLPLPAGQALDTPAGSDRETGVW